MKTMITKSGFWVCLFLMPSLSNASGFVKDPGQSYTKWSYSSSSERDLSSTDDAVKIREKTDSGDFYTEIGVPFLIPAQVSLFGQVKRVVRQSVLNRDSFASQSFADSKVLSKFGLFKDTFLPDSFPVFTSLSVTLGSKLPTTPSKYRSGQETRRGKDLSPEKRNLVAPVDAGTWGFVTGMGLSLAASGVWVSLTHNGMTAQKHVRETQNSVQLGVGLPGNSWIQTSYEVQTSGKSKPFNRIFTEGDGDLLHPLTRSEVFGIGLGLTFWQGVAFEAAAQRLVPRFGKTGGSYSQYTFGFSKRDI